MTELTTCLGSLYLHGKLKYCTRIPGSHFANRPFWCGKWHFPLNKREVSFNNKNYGMGLDGIGGDFKTAVQSHFILSYNDRACFIKSVLWLWCGMSEGVPSKKKHLLTSRDIKETVFNYTDCLSMLICIRKTQTCWTALQAPRQGPSHEAGSWGWHTDWTTCTDVKTFSSYGVKVIC